MRTGTTISTAAAQPPAPQAAARVRGVVPCHNRAGDIELLMGDLGRLRPRDDLDLRVLIVDNASEPPLDPGFIPAGVGIRVLRLEENRGGSGGFNAGLREWLREEPAARERDFLWLLDSDVRLDPGALEALLRELSQRPSYVAMASALCDPESGEPFEMGGRIDRLTGEYVQRVPRPLPVSGVVDCEYAAACSLLVRRWGVERAGVLADLFLNGDDAEWCVRLARQTGGRIGVAVQSRGYHPRPDRMRTWQRYYAARNVFAAMDALRLGPVPRFSRAIRETMRAVSQAMVGRDDLAELHLRGLRDAAARRRGRAALEFEPFRPFERLAEDVRGAVGGGVAVVQPGPWAARAERALEEVGARVERACGPLPMGLHGAARALRRAMSGAPVDVAVVSARARTGAWLAGRTIVTASPEGYALRQVRTRERLAQAVRILWRGLGSAIVLAVRRGPPPRAEPAAMIEAKPARAAVASAPTLSIVVVSYKRREALLRTLAALHGADVTRAAEIVVVDNASGDGSSEAARTRFPGVRLVDLRSNTGVAAFNEGVEAITGEVVLVLDDDAVPEPAGLEAALALMAARPDIAAIPLHPRHPATRASEWRFAARLEPGAYEGWPVLGCANLVRREAWLACGGYEREFFLYRNDIDLAMKLLGAGRGIAFNPAWVAWHDSDAAARKSARWFELATRNWIWMARRHGRGASQVIGALAGWAWAHRLAGLSLRAHARAIKGAARGLVEPPPRGAASDGRAFARFVGLRLGRSEATTARVVAQGAATPREAAVGVGAGGPG